MERAGRNGKNNKSYCFRGVRFEIRGEDLPAAVRESRRFHAHLVDDLAMQAAEHARLLAGRSRIHRERKF